MNMFLHEINDAVIEWGDTIRNPLHLQDNLLKTFDVVVANPPFSLDKWGEEIGSEDSFGRFKYGTPPKSKGDFAFVLHMISSLNSNEKMGVILPHGVLFRGASEGKIRTKLIEECKKAFEDVDVLVGPTAPDVAFKVGKNSNDPMQMYLVDIMTVAANLIGIPAISIPIGSVDGLPVGFQCLGKSRADRELLTFAKQVEEAVL